MTTKPGTADPKSAPTYRRKREAAVWIDQRLRRIVDESIDQKDYETALHALTQMQGLGDEA